MARDHVHPLALYVEDRIVLEKTEQDTINRLLVARAAGIRRGVTTITLSDIEVGPVGNGRFPVLVQWSFCGKDGEITRSRIRYYCRHTPDGGFKIEMMEYLQLGFPEILNEIRALQTKH